MTIRDITQKWYRNVARPRLDTVSSGKHFKELIVGLTVSAVIVIGIGGYTFYKKQKESAAYSTFYDCMQEYQLAIKNSSLWTQVEMQCSLGYEQHSNTNVAPYFLVMKSDALLRQEKREEALTVLDNALQLLPEMSPLLMLYQTKRGLLALDMNDPTLQKKALVELDQFAHDAKNSNRDLALYYVGLYYWSHDNLDDARRIWQELITQFPEETGLAVSPWAQAAKEKLSQII